MPISKVGLFRTDGQSYAPQLGSNTYVPFYAVLFWYGNDVDFNNTPSGTLNYDYYRQYREIYYPAATYYNTDGSFDSLKSNPLVYCVNADANWKTTTGLCTVPTTSLPNTGATLFSSHTHNPTTLPRTTIYQALGSKPGDTLSRTFTYFEQNGDHTHVHSTNNIARGLRSVQYGQQDADGNYQGLNAIAVDPIIRDPQLSTVRPGYNDTKLHFFPKNIIVFGNNLPSEYYTRDDSNHSSSANGKVLPIMPKGDDIGVLNTANTLSFTISSNSSPLHNHSTFPLITKYKTDKTNQTAYRLQDSGVHSHRTTYTANVALRSKILKAWITTSDQTPISNGVIIAYSIGTNTLYRGPEANSSTLPVNWHFCDGNNGTPDLRGYYVYANFDTSNNCHDTVYNSSNTYLITDISLEANGNHSHLGPLTGTEQGVGIATDIGSHTFEEVLNHTHTVSDDAEFKYLPSDSANVTNIKVGQTYSYTPPTVGLAFIMYNNTII